MKGLSLIFTIITLLVSTNNLNSLFRDSVRIQLDPSVPFNEFFLQATLERIYTPEVTDEEIDSFKKQFEYYVSSAYGSMDIAEDLFTNDLQEFANKFSKMITFIESDLVK